MIGVLGDGTPCEWLKEELAMSCSANTEVLLQATKYHCMLHTMPGPCTGTSITMSRVLCSAKLAQMLVFKHILPKFPCPHQESRRNNVHTFSSHSSTQINERTKKMKNEKII